MAKLKLYRPFFSYRNRKHIIIVGFVIGLSSLLFTNRLAHQLRDKEQNEVRLWSYVMSNLSDINEELYKFIVVNNNTVPFIVTDENLRVISSNLVPDLILKNNTLLRKKLEKMSTINPPIEVFAANMMPYYIFYDNSLILKSLYYFPYIQLSIFFTFILLSFITFSSSKHEEQNRVWIGMAKETAHQLGTPTSSLLGWIEYLKSQNVEDFIIEEMNKDITRLLKIVDRFSKIGAVTSFVQRDIAKVVNGTVIYFRARIPKNVSIIYEMPETAQYAMINDALFEWVIENLLKNSLDALQGRGSIIVSFSGDDKWLNIDVSDNGKGIIKSNFKRIFEPGFTTKTRGWGLGLSLSKRIVEEYHKGRIFVLESEIDKGTTIRVSLQKRDFRHTLKKHSFFGKLWRKVSRSNLRN